MPHKAYGNEWPIYRESKEYQERKKSQIRELRRRQAGRSFYAPFVARSGKAEELREAKYVYYCSLAHEAGLELNPRARLEWVNVLTAMKNPDIANFDSELQNMDTDVARTRDFVDLEKVADVLRYYQNKPGGRELSRCISNYVLTFNHNKNIPRIKAYTDRAIYLTLAIEMAAALEHKCYTWEQLDQKRMGDNYWVMQDKTDDITNRPDKERRKHMKAIAKPFDLHIVHEDALYQAAKLWYASDVILDNLTVASQLGEYHDTANGIVVKLPRFSNPGTAYHKIRDFSVATGYDYPDR